MNDIQLYVAIGLPTIAVLASLTVSLIQISAIREDIREIRAETRAQLATAREDTRAQIADIREDIHEIRADIKLLTGKVYEMMGQK
jgi:hypothetical protein